MHRRALALVVALAAVGPMVACGQASAQDRQPVPKDPGPTPGAPRPVQPAPSRPADPQPERPPDKPKDPRKEIAPPPKNRTDGGTNRG